MTRNVTHATPFVSAFWSSDGRQNAMPTLTARPPSSITVVDEPSGATRAAPEPERSKNHAALVGLVVTRGPACTSGPPTVAVRWSASAYPSATRTDASL